MLPNGAAILSENGVSHPAGLARSASVTHLDNPKSERVAERCGYQREGILRAWEPVKNEQPAS